MKRAPLSRKMGCLMRAVKPIISYRCSLWPPQRQIGNEVDALQRKMVAIACPLRRAPGEESDQFARRRGRHASRVAKDAGLWSLHWFDRALAWDDHVQRNHSGCSWNRSLCAFHDSSWLQARRSVFAAVTWMRVNAWTPFAGRTATRAVSGKVQPRWQEAVLKVRNGVL